MAALHFTINRSAYRPINWIAGCRTLPIIANKTGNCPDFPFILVKQPHYSPQMSKKSASIPLLLAIIVKARQPARDDISPRADCEEQRKYCLTPFRLRRNPK
jgi:hypothetical protein